MVLGNWDSFELFNYYGGVLVVDKMGLGSIRNRNYRCTLLGLVLRTRTVNTPYIPDHSFTLGGCERSEGDLKRRYENYTIRPRAGATCTVFVARLITL